MSESSTPRPPGGVGARRGPSPTLVGRVRTWGSISMALSASLVGGPDMAASAPKETRRVRCGRVEKGTVME